MPVEIEHNGIGESRRQARRNILDALKDAATTNVAASKARVRVGPWGPPHLRDSIETESRDPRLVSKGVHELVVKAGIEGSLVAWANEAGTGEGFDPPDTEDPFPPSTAPESWVYFNEKANQFFTTEGMTPQPYMGPGYLEGKRVMEARAREIHDA